jgi:hypothetical protein
MALVPLIYNIREDTKSAIREWRSSNYLKMGESAAGGYNNR